MLDIHINKFINNKIISYLIDEDKMKDNRQSGSGQTPDEIIRRIIDSQQSNEVVKAAERQVQLHVVVKTLVKFDYPKLAKICREKYEELYGKYTAGKYVI